MESFVQSQLKSIRALVGEGHVICGMSGGVDSSVAATLVDKAIGEKLTCIFVDNGLLRKGERERVEKNFKGKFKAEVRIVDASARFLEKLAGVTEPEKKRKIIGTNLSRSLKKRRTKSAPSTISSRGRSIPMSLKACLLKGPRPRSRRTITWADYRSG